MWKHLTYRWSLLQNAVRNTLHFSDSSIRTSVLAIILFVLGVGFELLGSEARLQGSEVMTHLMRSAAPLFVVFAPVFLVQLWLAPGRAQFDAVSRIDQLEKELHPDIPDLTGVQKAILMNCAGATFETQHTLGVAYQQFILIDNFKLELPDIGSAAVEHYMEMMENQNLIEIMKKSTHGVFFFKFTRVGLDCRERLIKQCDLAGGKIASH